MIHGGFRLLRAWWLSGSGSALGLGGIHGYTGLGRGGVRWGGGHMCIKHYLKVHGTYQPIIAVLITLLIIPLKGLIGVIPVIIGS